MPLTIQIAQPIQVPAVELDRPALATRLRAAHRLASSLTTHAVKTDGAVYTSGIAMAAHLNGVIDALVARLERGDVAQDFVADLARLDELESNARALLQRQNFKDLERMATRGKEPETAEAPQ